ncbi:lipocalin-like domain-containing protein [Vibrio rarus]|uniref:lipocalin-like domain-containing protein n=1 Tax=Vibrio rarus TaxID=413403 RepID=UPI0021C3EF3F|nr:lipocalin-like domain-containing protein [Vibrio rarus]
MQKLLKPRFILILSIVLVSIAIISLVIYRYWKAAQPPLITIDSIDTGVERTFEPVLPGKEVTFPEDFTIHPKYQHEIWRYIATLKDEQGNEYLVQWSLFRISMFEEAGVGWESPQIYTSQAIVTTPDQVYRDQRFARGGIGLVGMRKRPYQLSIDNWSIRSFTRSPAPGNLMISSEQFDVNLGNKLNKAFIPLGMKGYQVTHELQSLALYGYSAPYIEVAGTIVVGGKTIKVTGQAALSQVWGTDLIGGEHKNFSHFLFRLQDGRVLSVVKSRLKGDVLPYSYGNLFTPDGRHVTLSNDEIEMHAIGTTTLSNGKVLPLQWVVNVPNYNVYLTAKATRFDQWTHLSIPSWSGRMTVSGNIKAQGFLQLVGY